MKQRSQPLAFLSLAAAIGAGLSVAGFGALSCSGKTTASGDGQAIYTSSEQLGPDKQPGWNAVLLYQDWEVPVQVEQKIEGNDITLRLLAKSQELEVERYRSTPSQFQLVQAASEQFTPPLPLLEFPLSEGELPKWSGKLIFGELEKEASAVVEVRKAPLNVKGYNDEGIKAVVKVSFDGGGPKETVRVLNFWFVPGRGILKREYEKGTTRIPAPPGVPSEGKAG